MSEQNKISQLRDRYEIGIFIPFLTVFNEAVLLRFINNLSWDSKFYQYTHQKILHHLIYLESDGVEIERPEALMEDLQIKLI